MKRKHEWAREKVEKLSPNSIEKATLSAIAKHANDDGGNSWPSIATIAKITGKSKRTISRHIKNLVDRGELVSEVHGKKGFRTNMYYIPICRLTAEERELIPLYAASDTEHKRPIYISRHQMKIPLPNAEGMSQQTAEEWLALQERLAKSLSMNETLESERQKGIDFERSMRIPKLTEAVVLGENEN